MSETKFCIDCKYAIQYQSDWRCNKSKNLVTGFPEPCHWMRGIEGKCGNEGKWFEPSIHQPEPNSVLCHICNERESEIHLTQIRGDKMEKLEFCKECAKAKGIDNPDALTLADLLLGLGKPVEPQLCGPSNPKPPSE